MKIPIKKYEPNPEAVRAMLTVLDEPRGDDDPIRLLAVEFDKLLKHHEEETKFLLERLLELENGYERACRPERDAIGL